MSWDEKRTCQCPILTVGQGFGDSGRLQGYPRSLAGSSHCLQLPQQLLGSGMPG